MPRRSVAGIPLEHQPAQGGHQNQSIPRGKPVGHGAGLAVRNIGVFNARPFGEKRSREIDFMLFKSTERPEGQWLVNKDGYEYIIDDSRCFKQFTLRGFNGHEETFALPKFKRFTPFSVYIGRSWCTDGTWNYRLTINAYNQKWISFFELAIEKLTSP